MRNFKTICVLQRLILNVFWEKRSIASAIRKDTYSDRVISESLKAGYQKLYISVPGEYDMDKMVKHRSFFQSLSPIQARLALHGGMDILASHYQKLHYNTLHRY